MRPTNCLEGVETLCHEVWHETKAQHIIVSLRLQTVFCLSCNFRVFLRIPHLQIAIKDEKACSDSYQKKRKEEVLDEKGDELA